MCEFVGCEKHAIARCRYYREYEGRRGIGRDGEFHGCKKRICMTHKYQKKLQPSEGIPNPSLCIECGEELEDFVMGGFVCPICCGVIFCFIFFAVIVVAIVTEESNTEESNT